MPGICKLRSIPVCVTIILISLSILACRENKGIDNKTQIAADDARHLGNRHALGFKITETDGNKVLSVRNPWQGAKDVTREVFLFGRETPVPEEIDKAKVIRVPVESIVCLSTTHVGFISLLGESGKISGIAGSRYVSDEIIVSGIEEGRIRDLGYDQNLDYESLVKMKPDLVMVYGIGPETAAYTQRISELGIPVVFNAEYLEETALGKAEWIRFVGELFGKSELADSLFSAMEREYVDIKKLAAGIKEKPDVLVNLPWKGIWHMAGGRSFFAGLIADAGGNYLWKEDLGRESFPVGMENVFQRALHADIWINPGAASSIQDILSEEPRVRSLKPILTGKVFNNNARMSRQGGNDYWESGIVHPQVILRDLVHIFHPHLSPSYQLVYFQKLE